MQIQRDLEKEVHFNVSPPEQEIKPFLHRPAAASTMTSRAPVVIARTVPGSKYHLVKPNTANGHGPVITATPPRVIASLPRRYNFYRCKLTSDIQQLVNSSWIPTLQRNI